MKEHLSQLCDRYYEALDLSDRLAFKPGQIASAYSLYPPFGDAPLFLKISNYDPKGEKPTTFNVEPFYHRNIPKYEHPPIKEMHLESEEQLFVQKGKRRPCLCLGRIEVDWVGRQELCLVAPIFGLNEREEEFKNKVSGFLIPNLFYLPANPKEGLDKDSAIRMELTQSILSGMLQPYSTSLTNQPVQLTSLAFSLFLNHFTRFISNRPHDEKIDQEVEAFKSMIAEATKEQGL
jgi:hypothetical protein